MPGCKDYIYIYIYIYIYVGLLIIFIESALLNNKARYIQYICLIYSLIESCTYFF